MESTLKINVNLTPEELAEAKKRLGREPNETELGMIEVMWSEHCSYKSSRRVLNILPKSGRRVVVGPGYDSGVVHIGDGDVIAFKVESHNHPSAIDPYNGAATGVGGIIRDILCMNCRPIALLDSLRFGNPQSAHTRWLFNNVVKGIADYGNRTGIPTVAGEVEFDESFEVNCLVNVACVGLGRIDELTLARMDNPGDLIILVGGDTGRDGIHGVTFASKTIHEDSELDRPAVQVGNPFIKKLVIEATLEALRTGKVTAVKDLGGGGLTCALSEMSSKGGTGVDVELDNIHVREEGMTPYELLLSESQERMLFTTTPEGQDEVLKVLRKWEVSYSIIGKVTDTGHIVARHGGRIVVDIPSRLLTDPPLAKRRARKPLETLQRRTSKPPFPTDLTGMIHRLLSSPNIADTHPVYRQYDHEVGLRTILKPGDADAAVLRIIGRDKAVAVKIDCNSSHCHLNPYAGHAAAVAEAARNVTATGAEPIAATDCCNFGNPEKPEVYWQFKEAIRGITYMLKGLGLPCVGGNVSFYNEDEKSGRAIKPTTTIVMLGLIERLSLVTSMALKKVGESIILLGKTYPELGGSEYYRLIGFNGGKAPAVVDSREKASIHTVAEAIRKGYVTAAHDCSKGGLAVSLAEMAIKGGLGLRIDLASVPCAASMRMDEILFSESSARFIITTSKANASKIISLARRRGVSASKIGEVSPSNYTITVNRKKLVECPVESLKEAWQGEIQKIMGDS
ncbi:MAG: phosphoribosylformylglycinamidine synthase subunit PurL [Candidatus Bathyarchaeia archaeon]